MKEPFAFSPSITQPEGFTKHELGAFMIAQGLVAKYNLKSPDDQLIIASLSYQLAETILQQFETK